MEVSCGPADRNGAERLFAEQVWRWTLEDLDSSWRAVFQLLNFQQADLESHALLQKGSSCVKNKLLPSSPLELSEKIFQLNQDKMNFSTLRKIQGLFTPLKLQMEFKAVQQVRHLPFLPRSNLSLDILRGNNGTIGFEDVLNNPSQSELIEPHLMVEYKLGLL